MKRIILFVVLSFIGIGFYFYQDKKNENLSPLKLYWFIPDGLRAEPDIFKIYEWAKNGELPNIKKMMDQGSYGYSLPVFPSHTPVNFAALLTGTLPKTNGVADGPMHTEGHPLNKVSIGGFSSAARKIPAVWTHLEKIGLKVGIISTPGSTPPEIENGFVIRGRWGNWGIDTPSINVEYIGNNSRRYKQGQGSRFFYFGPHLTQYVDFNANSQWSPLPTSLHPAKHFQFKAWDNVFFAALIDSSNDGIKKYDKISFSLDGKNELCRLAQQEWSDWYPATLSYQGLSIDTHLKLHVIKLDGDRFFRIRVLFDSLNETLTFPSTMAKQLSKNLGPMVDFVDNFPPQLIYFDDDKKTFLAEQAQSFSWHTKAIPYLVNQYKPNVVIHNIYNPNQMLTSRWWMSSVDPESTLYATATESDHVNSWNDVKAMYKQIDEMIGQVLKVSDKNTVIVLSSDHGVAPLNSSVHLNNLFSKKGWLKFKIDPTSGEPQVDWYNSQVIFLKMDGIFIKPDGLHGNWTRGHGVRYEKLREEVISLLTSLKDKKGLSPISRIVKWEDVPHLLGLPSNRVGDLVVANTHGYGFSEELSNDLKIFSNPLVSGYKQAILPTETKSMWTPFIISGPNIKKNNYMQKPFVQIDQLPTILKAMSIDIKQKMDGTPLDIFNE